MMKKIVMTTIATAIVCWTAGAEALAESNSKKVTRDARACLRTDPVQVQGTIVDAAVATPTFSTLVGVLQTAGLVSALQEPGPFTVFAPTNEAFAQIPNEVLNAIVNDPAVLTDVLTYHVVADSVRPRASTKPNEVHTLQGQSVFLSLDADGPRVNQSNIACQAVKTDNGTIWVIDSVLLPQF
jgi:uncharacterized surface protein with fasciclin (FAS1) repeats